VNANDATLTELAAAQDGSVVPDNAPNSPAGGNFNLFMKAIAGLCHPPAGLRPAPARKERNQP
jgi:hypothetical protein